MSRCRDKATGVLVAPDGEAVPHPGLCKAHADAVIAQYRQHLGEQWTLRPFSPEIIKAGLIPRCDHWDEKT